MAAIKEVVAALEKSLERTNKMAKLIYAAIVAVSLILSQSVVAQKPEIGTARPAGVAAPVDFHACNFKEGKSREDLDALTAKFRDYANKNDYSYAAWILTPQYHSQSNFDFGWLGAWPDGEAFGVSMEKWMSNPALEAEFSAVMDCSNHHEMAMSLPINAADSTPQDGIMLVYQCSLQDDKTFDAAHKAHLEWGTTKKALGFLDNSWLFRPEIGIRDIDFDYYHIVVFYRYSDLGAAMEIYANGDGKKKREKIYAGITDCGRPFIYDFMSVRDRDER